MYREIVSAGVPEPQAQAMVRAMWGVVLATIVILPLIVQVIVYLVVGIAMAAIWDRLGAPWYAKALIFSAILVLLDLLPAPDPPAHRAFPPD